MKQYVVDAFTDKVFSGNPAAICIMDSWLPDELMVSIAAENNLSETAFAVKNGEKYHLRWFTLAGEIDLCGHATLACAYVVLNHVEKDWNIVTFETLSGDLTVSRKGDLYEMDFPAYDLKPVEVTPQITDAIGARPDAAYMGRDLLCVYKDEAVVRRVTPDMDKVKALEGLLLHITARGSDTDCVSRSFAPKCNFPEDPVCGSGHCHIVPYWAKTLQRETIVAYQASKRGGTLYCKMDGSRVKLAGKAALFAIAEIFIDEQ
ncbi:PhzF family phenazine biosynthesis protein [Christensenellaceae bacterium OttesenSCG-928-M15]|nr:PhzF family phenazine biosynthesis protein [Christensenellaceae bacterium OttesenSCG-928-M15]